MRIGVFGGTFDPPHIAHLILAEEAGYQLNLERILWVLTPTSPLKPDRKITPWQQRLEMLQAAIAENPRFEISRIDIDRSPPYFSYITLKILERNYPLDDFVFLIGGDSLTDFPRWEKPEQIITKCKEIGVMHRPGEAFDLSGLENLYPGLQKKIRWIEAPLLQISGSLIRQKIRAREPIRYYLPEKVFHLILEQRPYDVEK